MGRFIGLSPLCLVATADASGKQDVTPRGDPPGSFKVLDEHTIALADRPGNRRLDTLKNLLENPEIALIFLVPGITETVRVAGTARLSVDPELLASMAVQGKEPKCAIVISVRQAYLHCAKALLRSKLWQPDYVQSRSALPSIIDMLGDQIGFTKEEKKVAEERAELSYKDGLWAPIP
jgi:PPOX class probable FMN-dependent enzyme